MENAHSAFFAVVMHPKEAAGDRTCESADQLVVLMNRLLKGAVFLFKGQLLLNDEMFYYKESVKFQLLENIRMFSRSLSCTCFCG